MNLHAASQFRVLQHRLTKVYVINDKEKDGGTDKYYATFKGYIKQHQMLILYCNKLEEVFNLMVLAQVLLFSLLICLDGYLVIMVSTKIQTIEYLSLYVLPFNYFTRPLF